MQSTAGLADLLSLRLAPVQESIVENLGPTEFCRLLRVSKNVRSATKVALTSIGFNINAALSNFFNDPKKFRSIQGQCNALICGTFAFSFFARRKGCTELTILGWIHDDAVAAGVMDDYLEREGYKPQDDGWVSKVGANDTILRICFKKTKQAPLEQAILSGHNTSTMNFISWNKAFSLNPRGAFLDNEYIRLDCWSGEYDSIALLADDSDTESMIDARWNVNELNQEYVQDLRRVGDSYTWIINLDTSGITRAPVPDAILESSTFRLMEYQHLSEWWIEMDDHVFRGAILKHPFVTSTALSGKYKQKFDALAKRLHEIPSFKRDYELTVLDRVRLPRGKEPEWWLYYDDYLAVELAKMWEEYEQEWPAEKAEMEKEWVERAAQRKREEEAREAAGIQERKDAEKVAFRKEILRIVVVKLVVLLALSAFFGFWSDSNQGMDP
ncbi:Nn.00g011490.m01.CDS01 [Neocucurbitaria sp. VM-36]